MRIENPITGEVYTIRAVPLEEAVALSASGIEFYDYTKLTAVNTCPTYGVMRYALHKTDIPLTMNGRKMALECGKACHDFYAALRMWTLLHDNKYNAIPQHEEFMKYGRRLFGEERWESMGAIPQDSDRINNAQLFALDALHSSGYLDDDSDRKRTMANMELACLGFTDRYFKSNMPVLVRGDFIGIELPFVLEVTYTYKAGGMNVLGSKHYYCGRIDGVHVLGDQLAVAENKTAANLSATWRTSFAISNQVTGYTLAATVLLNETVDRCIVMGSQIPPPRDVFNGTVFELCTRSDDDRLRWCEWFFHSIGTYEEFTSRPTEAPRYSHSCNRFFSACEFIPFCASERVDQRALLEDMRVERWSPLDHLQEKTVEGAD